MGDDAAPGSPDAEVEIEEGTAPTPRERQRAARQKLGELAGFALEQSTKLTPTDEGFTVQTGEQTIECTVAEDDGDGRHTTMWEGRRDQWMAVVAAAAWGGGPRGPTSAASSAAPSAGRAGSSAVRRSSSPWARSCTPAARLGRTGLPGLQRRSCSKLELEVI